MKKIAILVLVAAAMLFAQQGHKRHYHTAFCTNVYGVDYCSENLTVTITFKGKRIAIDREGALVIGMKTVGGWKRDPETGDSSIVVDYDGFFWTLTAGENFYRLEDHYCSLIELWGGSRESQRKKHGYIRMDSDEMFEFEHRCELNSEMKPRELKRKMYDSGKLIMGMIGE